MLICIYQYSSISSHITNMDSWHQSRSHKIIECVSVTMPNSTSIKTNNTIFWSLQVHSQINQRTYNLLNVQFIPQISTILIIGYVHLVIKMINVDSITWHILFMHKHKHLIISKLMEVRIKLLTEGSNHPPIVS